MAKREKSCGFAIGIASEEMIAEDARSFVEEHGRPKEYERFLTKEGAITDAGWKQLNEDIPRIERNAMAWLRKTFNSARDDGHSGEELVGSVWYDPADERQMELIELAAPGAERIDFQDTGFGGFRTAFDGVSKFGSLVLGGAIVFFDVDEEF